jgi:hypothetical protein
MASHRNPQSVPSAPWVALLAWLLPGLGHWWIGQRSRAVIFFVITGVTFWGGVAVAGVRTAVTVRDNGLWIAAQLCMGPQTLGALSWSNSLAATDSPDSYKSPWPSADIGVVYAGVAGLLNLLIIIDALARLDRVVAERSARSPPRRGGR